MVHNLLMQFFTLDNSKIEVFKTCFFDIVTTLGFFPLDSSKIEVFKTCFFDIVTTQYDHPSYLKRILGRIYMFCTLFGYWLGGGLPREWYTACSCSFSLWTAQKWKFSKLVFLIF